MGQKMGKRLDNVKTFLKRNHDAEGDRSEYMSQHIQIKSESKADPEEATKYR